MSSTNVATVGGISFSVLLLVGWYLRARRRRSAMLALRNKVVLITGASAGLGEACARMFYRAGCKVILSGRRVSELERVADELRNMKVNVPVHEPRTVQLDLAQFSEIPDAAQRALTCHGHIDVVINNAGLSYRGEIETTSLDVYMAVMNVNYFGQIALTKAILPSMIERRTGHLVAISSVQGKLTIPYRSAYGASKHAMQSFFDCLRAEVAHHEIFVSVISPGYIHTDISLNALTGDGSKHGVVDEEIRLGMTPDFVADKILRSVAYRQNDVVVAPVVHRLASYLNQLFPNLFARIMAARAKKQRTKKSKSA